jgi:hypothetical protein
VTAHHWYAMALAWHGRLREAITEIEKARHLDPLSMRANLTVAQIVFCTRDYDRVLRESQTALELQPDNWAPHALVAHVYLKRGVYA